MLNSIKVKRGETMYTALPLIPWQHADDLRLRSMALDAKFAIGDRFSASWFWNDCRKFEAVEFNTLGRMIPILLRQQPRVNHRDHKVRVVLCAACLQWVGGIGETFRREIIEFTEMVD